MYNIILKEDIETKSGVMVKGDVLETVQYDDDISVRRYIADTYLIEGILVEAVKI